jgi:hypothetical protein
VEIGLGLIWRGTPHPPRSTRKPAWE